MRDQWKKVFDLNMRGRDPMGGAKWMTPDPDKAEFIPPQLQQQPGMPPPQGPPQQGPPPQDPSSQLGIPMPGMGAPPQDPLSPPPQQQGGFGAQQQPFSTPQIDPTQQPAQEPPGVDVLKQALDGATRRRQ